MPDDDGVTISWQNTPQYTCSLVIGRAQLDCVACDTRDNAKMCALCPGGANAKDCRLKTTPFGDLCTGHACPRINGD